MSLKRTFVIHCDSCDEAMGDGIITEHTVRDTMKWAKKMGWQFPIENGKRKHICPSCVGDRLTGKRKTAK